MKKLIVRIISWIAMPFGLIAVFMFMVAVVLGNWIDESLK